MRAVSAVALACLLFVSILLLWVPGRWAVSMLQAGISILAIAWAIRMLFRPYRLETHFLLLPLSAAVLWGLLQLATHQTVYRWETWNAVLSWATNLALVVVGLQIFCSPRLRAGFLRAALVFGFVLSVISLLQLFTAEDKIFWLFDAGHHDFTMGPFVYHNQYAAFIELLLPLALVAALMDRRHMLLYAVIAATMYASVIAAASRGGFILASAELIVVPALVFHQDVRLARRAGLMLAMVLALVVAFTLAVGWDVLWKRLQQPDPYAGRREFFHSSLDMIRVHPYMGFGLGTWSTAYPGYAYFDDGLLANQAHNDWVQWTCEGGLPFLAIMLAIASWSFRAAIRSFWGVGVVSVFLHCLIDYPIQRPALAAMFFVFLAVLASESKTQEI